ncbi:hypothetical protein VTJ04DRAFT_227 [Mycothermus thermophilus]|uniref:uncharacterized protein n=1 Tax=Humicola insolens TaxID=85995 RepID=UPI003744B217
MMVSRLQPAQRYPDLGPYKWDGKVSPSSSRLRHIMNYFKEESDHSCLPSCLSTAAHLALDQPFPNLWFLCSSGRRALMWKRP